MLPVRTVVIPLIMVLVKSFCLMDVYMDVMDMPVEPCPRVPSDSKKNAGSITDISASDKTGGIVPVVGRIVRIPPWTVYIERVVDRNIGKLRGRWFDPDGFLFDDYFLLFRCREIPLTVGAVTPFWARKMRLWLSYRNCATEPKIRGISGQRNNRR